MILRYLVAGTLATVMHFTTLIVLVEIFYTPHIIATTIGFIFAIGINYPLQYFWVFKNSSEHQSVFLKYILVTIFTMLINAITFWILLNIANLWYLFSQIASTLIVFSINYTINKSFTFARDNTV